MESLWDPTKYVLWHHRTFWGQATNELFPTFQVRGPQIFIRSHAWLPITLVGRACGPSIVENQKGW